MARGNECGMPGPAEGAQVDRIKSYLAELKDIGPGDYEIVTVTLKKSLLAGTTTGNDTYPAPGNRQIIIGEIHPHLALINAAGESLAIANLGNPSLADREILKMMNCRVQLQVKNHSLDLFQNASKTISLNSLRKRPMNLWHAPYIVPMGGLLQMDATLVDTTAAVVGGETEYGLMLVCIQIKR